MRSGKGMEIFLCLYTEALSGMRSGIDVFRVRYATRGRLTGLEVTFDLTGLVEAARGGKVGLGGGLAV